MTNEDLEKRMEFIIEQQAQSVAQIGQLEELLTRFATASSQRFLALEEGTSRRFADVDEKFAALVDSQIRLTEAQSRTEEGTSRRFADVDEKIAALVNSQIRLTEAQSRTEESLKNLMAVVDRHLSEGRNGKSGN
ncbi:MAG TPA: hypothetical protein VM911_17775 [Pyrinomonadaceae bacterium]|jgi:hypothetical protein|nr:hypothetical protein [Pyrinomonadaceae bacterium]